MLLGWQVNILNNTQSKVTELPVGQSRFGSFIDEKLSRMERAGGEFSSAERLSHCLVDDGASICRLDDDRRAETFARPIVLPARTPLSQYTLIHPVYIHIDVPYIHIAIHTPICRHI